MYQSDVRFVDCHVHFQLEHLDDFVGSFDEIGLSGAWNIVHDPSLHGGATERDFFELLRLTRERADDTVHTFYWPPYGELTDPTFPKRCAKRIAELHKLGIVGVKVWKDLGLGLKDPDGRLMMLDDERLNPIWEKMVELKLILIAHVADPANFWLPMDESNPAYAFLKERPDWHFGKPGLPSREVLFEARDALHRRFPELVIVNCHCGGYAESLEQLGGWMDAMPNFHASIGWSHVKERGEPVRKFLDRHADRIMFETDLGMRRGRKVDRPWNRDAYAKAHGVLRDLFAPYGVDVFEKFAHLNAERLIRQTNLV
ncbi:MAG TPA: amidohydrolase family protein [Planctomycetota bacterium]|nr:amidohydrolase family protein [Planctomycetota bacterium]